MGVCCKIFLVSLVGVGWLWVGLCDFPWLFSLVGDGFCFGLGSEIFFDLNPS